MKKINTKKAGLLYGLTLLSYTGFALLDSFVIPHPVKTVMASPAEEKTKSSLEESIEAKIQEKLGTAGNGSAENTNTVDTQDSTVQNGGVTSGKEDTVENTDATEQEDSSAATSAGTVIGSYSDSKSKITLKQYRAYDSTIYVADVTVSDVSSLKTALADDTYGRNITELTSEIASNHNAVLAINGDYYGARQSGYVLRNGQSYRNSSGSREALAILKNGDFQFVTEGEVSLDNLLQNGALQVFSFGPTLLKNGSIAVSENEEVGMAMASNPRTAIGRLGKNHYVFVVSDGRTEESAGLSLYQLASFMKTLGVSDAYNLDGGGSSTMIFQGKIINNPTTNGHSIEERAVSDILYIGGEKS